jgi:hypothetical protein
LGKLSYTFFTGTFFGFAWLQTKEEENALFELTKSLSSYFLPTSELFERSAKSMNERPRCGGSIFEQVSHRVKFSQGQV